MLFVYASRTGNVQNIIDKLSIEALKIDNGNESVDKEFILFTYTDGLGEIPYEVQAFLEKNKSYIKGVIASGDPNYGEDNFCASGNLISENYQVPLLYKVENDGNDEDIAEIKKIISQY